MCAASELPLTDADEKFFSELFFESIVALGQENLLRKTPRGWVYSGTTRATEAVNLESITGKTVTVVCNGNILETLPLNKAYEEAHAGAILLHQGETYVSEELDLNRLTAKVRQENTNYYTEALKTVDVAIQRTFKEKQNGVKISLGELTITENYPMYITKTYDEIINKLPLNLPPLSFSTVGLWFIVPEQIKEEIESEKLDFEGGLHAIEHAMIAMSADICNV
jgi:DEAD/DEAH box helicase domain-containing protein